MSHDFTALFNQFAAVIPTKPKVFTSHAFILRLAKEYQSLYVEALNNYVNTDDPFRRVHAVLSKHLHSCPQVRHLGAVRTPNIFGEDTYCGQWEKV